MLVYNFVYLATRGKKPKTVTIRVSQYTRRLLTAFKVYDKESYNDVVERLIAKQRGLNGKTKRREKRKG